MPQAGVWALQTLRRQLHNGQVASMGLEAGPGGGTRGGRRWGRRMREWKVDQFLEENEGETNRTEKRGLGGGGGGR